MIGSDVRSTSRRGAWSPPACIDSIHQSHRWKTAGILTLVILHSGVLAVVKTRCAVVALGMLWASAGSVAYADDPTPAPAATQPVVSEPTQAPVIEQPTV